MQDAWEIYAQGADEIPVFYLDGVSDLLGEVHSISISNSIQYCDDYVGEQTF